jgi:hypothetical protein
VPSRLLIIAVIALVVHPFRGRSLAEAGIRRAVSGATPRTKGVPPGMRADVPRCRSKSNLIAFETFPARILWES